MYIAFTFLALLGMFLQTIPSLQVTIRVVPFSQRSFAVGIQWMIIRCLGTIPGPIVYGTVLDFACLFRGKSCDGSEGSCSIYENSIISKNLLTITITLQVATILFFIIAYWTYKPDDKDSGTQIENNDADQTLTTSDGISNGTKQEGVENPVFDGEESTTAM